MRRNFFGYCDFFGDKGFSYGISDDPEEYRSWTNRYGQFVPEIERELNCSVQKIVFVGRTSSKTNADESYLINGTDVVTFGWSQCKPRLNTIMSLHDILESRKRYGEMIRRRADKAGVPWCIANLTCDIQTDLTAMQILKNLRKRHECYEGLSDDTRHELLECGIDRRTDAIMALIGKKTFCLLSAETQEQTKNLARYLAGEEVY